jgi:flagella basal body P-ring formation protein FlgA
MRVGSVIIAAVLALAGVGRAQSVIELRPRALAEPGAPVTLKQVASLTGPDALAAAGTVLAPALPADGELALRIERVREQLSRAGVRWSRTSLRGGECLVRAQARITPAPRSPAAPNPQAPVAGGPGSIRAALITRIARFTQTELDDLRLTFDSSDETFLATAIAGRTVEIKPTAASDRLPLAVTIFEGEHIATARTIRVGVEVRRTVLIAAAAKKKQETLGPEDFTSDTQWLGLSAKPATAEQAIGSALRNRLQPGELITVDDLASPIAVDKGEIVTVRCVSGGIAITTRGRAMAPARDGEMVKLQALDSPRTFSARMDGRGRAVLVSAREREPAPRRARTLDTPEAPR